MASTFPGQSEAVRTPTIRTGPIVALMCLAVFAVNVDTTIVNVTLPTLATELGSSTSQLQWIVDAYTLTFAALVLAGGSLGDRFGRRRLLVGGLILFGLGNALSALADTSAELIATRAFTGIGAAAVFPATLAILTNVLRDRADRAKAIGLWGATTGFAVALGPITGGLLLESFWWGATFLVKAPVAVLAALLVARYVPESRHPLAPRLDVPGLVLSGLALTTLVYTVIEAPSLGWGSVPTVSGFLVASVLALTFVRHERRTATPMLDLDLFRDRRFSASSLAITASFFALLGFTFLITQYFQLLRGYSALETGVRIVPVAVAVAAGNILGTAMVIRLGNKVAVTLGLLFLSTGYLWVSTASLTTPYLEIVGQMVVVGLGMGFTSAPATEAIMGATRAEQAGVGSAVNDATRELGGTLGIAVIGSVFASAYVSALASSPVPGAARDSVAAGLVYADALPGAAGEGLRAVVEKGFFDGLAAGCLVAAAVTAVAAVVTFTLLPGRPPVDAKAVTFGPG